MKESISDKHSDVAFLGTDCLPLCDVSFAEPRYVLHCGFCVELVHMV